MASVISLACYYNFHSKPIQATDIETKARAYKFCIRELEQYYSVL